MLFDCCTIAKYTSGMVFIKVIQKILRDIYKECKIKALASKLASFVNNLDAGHRTISKFVVYIKTQTVCLVPYS